MVAQKLSGAQPIAAGVLSVDDVVEDLRSWLETACETAARAALEHGAESLLHRADHEDDPAVRESCLAALRQVRSMQGILLDRFQALYSASLDRGFGHITTTEGVEAVGNRDRAPSSAYGQETRKMQDIIAKLRDRHRESLRELETRLLTVVPLDHADDDHPFDPAAIVAAFVHTCRQWQIPLEARLTLYRALEIQLCAVLSDIYDRLNAELESAGLPPEQPSEPPHLRAWPLLLEGPLTGGDEREPTVTEERDDDGPESSPTSQQSTSPIQSVAPGSKPGVQVRFSAREAVASRLANAHDLPVAIQGLLHHAWYRVLLVSGAKYGVASEGWDDKLHVVDKLIALMGPGMTSDIIAHPKQELAELQGRIYKGLRNVRYNSSSIDGYMGALEQHRPYTQYTQTLDVPAPASEGAGADPMTDDNEPDPELVRDLADIPTGSWFQLHLPNGTRQPACLYARVDNGWRYIFTDRAGKRITVYTIKELAWAVESRDAGLLDDASTPV